MSLAISKVLEGKNLFAELHVLVTETLGFVIEIRSFRSYSLFSNQKLLFNLHQHST